MGPFTVIMYSAGSFLHATIIIPKTRKRMSQRMILKLSYFSSMNGNIYCTAIKLIYLYESTCTFLTALPEGSIMFLKDASQARASAVLHATDGTDGTHDAAESEGKCSE